MQGTAAPPDLTTLGNYHAKHGTIPLSDEAIRIARCFWEWRPCFLAWPKRLWLEPEANAYHVRRLAEEMEAMSEWIGPALRLRPPNNVEDANHRLRAVQWLATRGVVIQVPIEFVQEK